MHAAQVTSWGQPPVYTEVTNPLNPPSGDNDAVQIKVHASGLHNIVRARASGSHYSSSVASLPHTPGIDGVGTCMLTGEKVYFSRFATAGSYAEYVNVPKSALWSLPDGVDPLVVAGWVNPVLSSWMALRHRTSTLEPGFSVLIMGVTSASGRAAVQVAKHLGAGKVIGVARNKVRMAEVEGLDGMVELGENIAETNFSSLGDVDVVLDYIYGKPAEHLLASLAKNKGGRAVQYIHIGGLGGTEMTLPGAVLRSMNLTIRGSGPGAWSMRDAGNEVPALLELFRGWKAAAWMVRSVSLREIERVWEEKARAGERVVFVMD